MTYNSHGDLLEELSACEQSNWSIDEHGQLLDSANKTSVSRSEARFQYDYDARGNWVKKVVESRGGTDLEFRVSTVEERTLTYSD
jgi:hypothetical protein